MKREKEKAPKTILITSETREKAAYIAECEARSLNKQLVLFIERGIEDWMKRNKK